jgi:nucleotide-binding universal stress UspA family protein
MFKKILAPVDLAESEMTKMGLDAAVALAKVSGGQLRLLSVQPIAPAAFMDYIPPNFDEELRVQTEKDLAETAAKIDYPKDLVTTLVRIGAFDPEVLAEAQEWGADLIVVGSHRPTMATYLIGSNAGSIVRHAKCSVLVVRA